MAEYEIRNPVRFYQPSGVVPIIGWIAMLALGGLAAAVSGAVYGLVCVYNPIIYINFLGVVVVALAIGYAVTIGMTMGRVRSPKMGALVGLLAGVFGLYVNWVVFVRFFIGPFEFPEGSGQMVVPWLFNPVDLWGGITFIGENGAWSLRNWTPTGLTLYAIWAIEAAVILIGSLALPAAHDTPYCETVGAWPEEKEDVLRLPAKNLPVLGAALEAEQYEVLQELRRHPVPGRHYLRVDLHICPDGGNEHFLTLKEIRETVNGEGKEETETEDFITNLCIPEDVVRMLQGPAPAPLPDEGDEAEETDDEAAPEAGEEAVAEEGPA